MLTGNEYNYIHKWNLRHWVKSGICEHCLSATKTHWSNKSGLYNRERSDWQELCPKCHHVYDSEILKVKFGRPRKSLSDPNYPHGTLAGYSRFKCRCDTCRKLWNEYRRKQK